MDATSSAPAQMAPPSNANPNRFSLANRLKRVHLDPIKVPAPTAELKTPIPILPSERFTTFHLFPFLPADIRIMIWELMLPEPQTLHLSYSNKSNQTFNTGYSIEKTGIWRFDNAIRRLSSLFACQEVVGVASRMGLVWERIQIFNTLTPSVWEMAWFNFKTDTLFINTDCPEKSKTENNYHERILPPTSIPLIFSVMVKLKFLAIGENMWFRWPFLEHLDYSEVNGYPVWKDEYRERWKLKLMSYVAYSAERVLFVKGDSPLRLLPGVTPRFKARNFGVGSEKMRRIEGPWRARGFRGEMKFVWFDQRNFMRKFMKGEKAV